MGDSVRIYEPSPGAKTRPVEVEERVDGSVRQIISAPVVESLLNQLITVTGNIPGGPPGPEGPTGPAGPAGPPAPLGFTFSQQVPATIWYIAHPYESRPEVDVFDQNGELTFADVYHPEPGVVRIEFAYPMTGSADVKP